MRDSFKTCIVGECMAMRPFGTRNDPKFEQVKEIVRRADFTYGHLETNLGTYDEVEWAAKAAEVGSYLLSDPKVAGELRALGIDVMSVAANHCMDYGEPGLMATMRHLEGAGLAFAGVGRDLEEAREPSYFESPVGRIGLVSVASGNKPQEIAGAPKGTMRGRPGVNPLRVRTRYQVTEADASELRRIWSDLGVLQEVGVRRQGSLRRNLKPGEFFFYTPEGQSSNTGTVFVEGEATSIETECDPVDLAGNLRVIDEAASMSDFVMIAHHVNVCEGGRGDLPPKFAREFAHAAIDAGADVYIGHGWHKTLGIEIYRGKPILYGLGNFFAQTEFIRRAPADAYEAWGHDMDMLPTLTPASDPLHPGLDSGNLTWWSSAVIELEIVESKCVGLRLHPVELGRRVQATTDITRRVGKKKEPLTDGIPMLASGADADAILNRYRDLSAGFGTEMSISDGVGVVSFD